MERCVEVTTHFAEKLSQAFDGVAVEDVAPIFGDEHQVNVHLKNTVSTVTNIVAISHRPSSMWPT